MNSLFRYEYGSTFFYYLRVLNRLVYCLVTINVTHESSFCYTYPVLGSPCNSLRLTGPDKFLDKADGTIGTAFIGVAWKVVSAMIKSTSRLQDIKSFPKQQLPLALNDTNLESSIFSFLLQCSWISCIIGKIFYKII